MDTLADYDRAKEMRDALTVLGLASPIIKQLRELPPSVAMPLMQQLLDAEPTAIPRVNAASTLV